ncbi:Mechanosensitive ion channel protein 10 [Babesia sp. Xinjiang]|uniref:Mechanosensitive ion channel protein 10 n=1 Tax=Babesia sp. Xinjiang TaxID=462227 RepID=UPI000A24A125|nr:Mechanosensitive ion channel protein 10 [Babesia sp. Xinjiang]ORM40682.1 Mechanosensitive ion channel protein 10 [Babesia sp. Xinjiang]
MHTNSIDSTTPAAEAHSNYVTARYNVPRKGPPIEYDETDDSAFSSGWCRPVDWFSHEFFHDNTAIWILSVHFLVFFIGMCFGPLTLPLLQDAGEGAVPSGESLMKKPIEAVDAVGASLSHFKTIRNGLFFLGTTMLMFIGTLIIVMTLRYIGIKLVIQPLYNISHLAVVVTYAMDPAAAYCIWTIINYAVLRKLTEPVYENNLLVYYRFKGLGERLSHFHEIDLRCYTWTNSTFQLLILISMRKLVLSSLLFFFEVTFLPNYSAELQTYLREQALLRKFNAAWVNFINRARDSEHPAVIEGLNTASDAIDKIPLPETPIAYDHKIYYDSSHFNIFRQPIHAWRMCHRRDDDIRKKVVCLSNMLTNWSALHHMVHHPPELLFLDFYVPLVSKRTVQEYSRLLFDHIYETMTALNHPEITDALSNKVQSSKTNINGNSTTEQTEDVQEVRQYDRISTLHALAKAKTSLPMIYMPSGKLDTDSCAEDEDIRPEPQLDRMATETEDRRALTSKMFPLLNQSVVEGFFSAYDIGNCGNVSSQVFTRNVLYMCSLRKRLMSALKNQRSILGLVHRLLSTALWFLIFVMYLMTFRVNKNVVLPSVIGFFSAMIVALSYMYTSFITAIIFVVLSNPYNVGDRIRIDNGEAMYVKSITTYNTVFRCAHEKIITYQNSLLSTMNITNETRARHAVLEIKLRVHSTTTPAALKQLAENIRSYVNGRPREFVRDGCFVYVSEMQVGHYFLISVLVTYMDSWIIPSHIFLLQNSLMMHIIKQCDMLGITYREPIAPVHFSGALTCNA